MSDGTVLAEGEDVDLLFELELLEEKIQAAIRSIESLRTEKVALERENQRLRNERVETVTRLTRLVEKVDSLGVAL